ncbi:MAG TPA: CARDB domain-containing protein [Candidatus Thermoplasmatota archaeon]|nr:CARDB domain-containing protein [Candidatus Thermoplasmatota archaeon]
MRSGGALLAVAATLVAVALPVLATSATVTVGDSFYSPTRPVVAIGESVTWHWTGSGSHTVNAVVNGALTSTVWCSSRAAPAADCVRTFSTGGAFGFGCLFHSAMRGTVHVLAPGAPDLAITSVVFEDEGSTRHIRVTVRNDGTQTSPASTVRATYLNAATQAETVGPATVPALAGGASTVVDLPWTATARAGEFELTIKVDPTDTLPEFDEADNTRVEHTTFLVAVVPGVRVA